MTAKEYCKSQFSPPHGDDTMDFYYWGIVNLFSSPYGDCTFDDNCNSCIRRFSPPYGEWYYITTNRGT